MYPAGLCERWAGFFWQLPLLVYIIWLNFLPMTSLAPCYTTCGVRENPPSHTHIMQPPRSFYFFFILPLSPPCFPPDLRARQPSFHHFRPCFFFAFSLHPSQFASSLHPFFPAVIWKHLPPAACFLCARVCVQIWSMQVTIWHPCFCTVIFLRCIVYYESLMWIIDMNLWWEELTYQQDVRCWKTQNPKQAYTHISFDCRVLHFNPLLCFWTPVAGKQWEFKIILAQRTGGAVDFPTHAPSRVSYTFFHFCIVYFAKSIVD